MKKIIILILALLTTPIFCCLDCIDNSEHLAYGDYDTKMWHSVECDCPCTYVKGRKCVECGHMQNARPLTIVKVRAAKTIKTTQFHEPQTMETALNNLIQKYKKTQ